MIRSESLDPTIDDTTEMRLTLLDFADELEENANRVTEIVNRNADESRDVESIHIDRVCLYGMDVLRERAKMCREIATYYSRRLPIMTLFRNAVKIPLRDKEVKALEDLDVLKASDQILRDASHNFVREHPRFFPIDILQLCELPSNSKPALHHS